MQPSDRQNFVKTYWALAAIAVITFAAASSAFAQQFAQWPKQCHGDLSRLCRDVANGEDRAILTCLQEKQQKLSAGCRKQLQSYGHVPADPPPARRR
jgi:hypothetical protein